MYGYICNLIIVRVDTYTRTDLASDIEVGLGSFRTEACVLNSTDLSSQRVMQNG